MERWRGGGAPRFNSHLPRVNPCRAQPQSGKFSPLGSTSPTRSPSILYSFPQTSRVLSTCPFRLQPSSAPPPGGSMEPPPPGGPGAWSSQPSPFPWGPKCLDSWEGSKGMWADGPEAAPPPPPQLPADRAPLWGLNTVSNLPRPPTRCVPLRRGARAALGWRRPGRPHGSQLGPCHPTPSPGIGHRQLPIVHGPTKLLLFPGRGAGCAAPPRGLCPPPQSSPRRKPLPLPAPPRPHTGAPCRVAEPSLFWGEAGTSSLPLPALLTPSPHSRSGLERPGLS